MAFRIIRNDITRVRADAIVNTANPEPVYAGGTDAAVYQAAGAEALLAERKKIGVMREGEAHATPAFALPAKYVIHTVSPCWKDRTTGERETLRQCYENSLRLAVELGCGSIAFPLLGAGVCGFPKKEAVQTALSAFRSFLEGTGETADGNGAHSDTPDLDIILVVFGRLETEAAGSLYEGLEAYIDDRFVEERCAEEYRMDAEEPAAPRERRSLFRKCMDKADELLGQAATPKKSAGKREKRAADGMDRIAGKAEISQNAKGGAGRPGIRSAADRMEEAAGYRGEPEHEAPSRKRKEAQTDEMQKSLPGMGQASQPQGMRGGMGQPQAMQAMAAAPVQCAASQKRRSLEELMSEVSESWQESLFRLIDQKGYTDSEVYKRANLDRKLFSKIRNNMAYQPKKSTAVALAVALRLNLDETKDFLARAGYALSRSSRSDIIVEYFIEEGIYDIYEIEMALFEHELPLLGA